ncbi:MAG: hypothetical protein ACLSVD_01545 [Eggerthellaceae bacterium]
MSEADQATEAEAAGWLLAGILLLALCGAMAAFQASTAGSAASVVPNPSAVRKPVSGSGFRNG